MTFGSFIRSEIERLSASHKDIAGVIHSALVAKDEFDTVKTKLSKLVNDEPEGMRYFFDPKREDRLRGLALALSTTTDALVAKRHALASFKTLVLDPRLASTIKDRLTSLAGDAYAVVLPEAGDDVLTALRDAATAVPNAVVVLAKEADVPIIRLTKLECTLAWPTPRSVKLSAFPGLVPVPDPRAPRLFEDNGDVLVPLPQITLEQVRGQQTADGIRAALEQGEIPSVPLAAALSILFGNYNARIKVVRQPKFTLERIEGREHEDTEVWTEGQQVYALGRRFEDVRAALAPYHIVQAPPQLAIWQRVTQEQNPWSVEVEAKDPQHEAHELLEALSRWASAHKSNVFASTATPAPRTGTLATRDQHADVREFVDELARRPVDGSARTIPFILSRVSQAQWVVFNASSNWVELVADVGAGNVVNVDIRKFSNSPSALRNVDRNLYDGGDVVLSLSLQSDQRLEGPLLPARDRRKAAEDDYQSDD
jgi:hypothetical protein